MNIEEIDKINHIYHSLNNSPFITDPDKDLLDYLRSIEVDQPLTSQHRQQIADLYNKYNLQE